MQALAAKNKENSPGSRSFRPLRLCSPAPLPLVLSRHVMLAETHCMQTTSTRCKQALPFPCACLTRGSAAGDRTGWHWSQVCSCVRGAGRVTALHATSFLRMLHHRLGPSRRGPGALVIPDPAARIHTQVGWPTSLACGYAAGRTKPPAPAPSGYRACPWL